MADRLIVGRHLHQMAYLLESRAKGTNLLVTYGYVLATPGSFAPGGTATIDTGTGVATLTATLAEVGSTSIFRRGFLLSRSKTPKLFSQIDQNMANYDSDFVVTGDAGWAVVGGEYKSNPIGNNQRAEVTLAIKGPATLMFDYRSNCELNDTISVLLDGVALCSQSGIKTAYSTYTGAVPEGDHTLTIRYQKGSATVAGDDAAYFRNLVISANSDIYDLKVEESPAPQAGEYSLAITEGLVPNTIYNVRPFLVTDAGVVYGDIMLLNTSGIPTTGWGGKIGSVDNAKMQAVAVGGLRIDKANIQKVSIGAKVI